MHARGVIRRREENAKGGGVVERTTERADGRGREREVKKGGEVPFRRYVRYFVRGRVRKRDITRTLFHLRTRRHSISRPLRSVPFFLLPSSLRPVFHAFAPLSSQPSIRLHLTAFGETEPTPRITELSSWISPTMQPIFPPFLRNPVRGREPVDNLSDRETLRSVVNNIRIHVQPRSPSNRIHTSWSRTTCNQQFILSRKRLINCGVRTS